MRVKLMFILLTAFCIQVSASVYGQKINLQGKKLSIAFLITEIEKQTNYTFFYNKKDVLDIEPINVAFKNTNVEDALLSIFKELPCNYEILDKVIILTKKASQKERLKTDIGELAQEEIVISGHIKDGSGKPLPSVSVMIKGSKKGTSTDTDGKYSLKAERGNTIVYRAIGYKTQEIIVTQSSVLNIQLAEAVADMDEVVVIAYGRQQSKLSNVAAISTIRSAEIKQSPAASISVALAGRLPGLTSIQRTGEPGRENNVLLIRGKGTFNTQSPLVVVDGIERSDYLNGLDPNEVETISILKDASSTALYGVRGANGVIIVTTKRGVADQNKISFSAEHALQNYTRFPDRVNAYDYAILENERRTNSGLAALYTDKELDHWKNGDWPEAYPNIDWFKEFTKSFSPQNRYNLNLSGGTKKIRYFVNAGYIGQQGLWKTDQKDWNANTTLDRYNFRTNLDADLTSSLKASLQLSGYLEKQNRPVGFGTDPTVIIVDALMRTPPGLFNPLTPDGEVVNVPGQPSSHPLYGMLNRRGYTIQTGNNINATFALEQDFSRLITPGLSIKGLFAFDSRAVNAQTRSRTYASYRPEITGDVLKYVLYEGVNSNLGNASVSSSFLSNSTLQFSTNYARTFGPHQVNALLLYQQESKLINAELPYNYRSFAGRFAYAFRNRYFAEINLGYNGSEQFVKGNRYGFFPAASAGWLITGEDWAQNSDVFTSFKVRASYGLVGNDRMGSRRFLYLDDYGVGGAGWSDLGGGTSEKVIGNYNITWEKARKFNIGIDGTLFKHFSITADYFREFRYDILASLGTVPVNFGNNGALPPLNIGKVQNNGYEVEIGYNKQLNNNMSLMVRGNVAYARNKILYRDEPIRDASWTTRYPSTGMMIDQPVGLVVDGYFNTQQEIDEWPNQSGLGGVSKLGDFKYMDQNGDKVIDVKDEVALGYPGEPLINFGLSLSFTYKNFDVGGLLQGSAMKSLYISANGGFPSQFNAFRQFYLGRWTPERYAAGEEITFPRLTSGASPNERVNSFFIEDASFLRLKTFELGYTLPKGLIKKMGAIRIFATGLNLFTWDRLSSDDFDPEMSWGSGMVHPLFKVYNFGLTANF